MTAIDPERPVAIVGAGIAGLTMALELSRIGFRAQVFERAERLQAAGAGIQIPPNALRVLDRLGLRGDLLGSATIADAVTLRSGRSGRKIAVVPVASSDGTAYLSLHRGDLQRVLADVARADPSITLRLGHDLSAVRRTPDGVVLSFVTEKGVAEYPAELVVGADGVRSALASQLGLPAEVATGVTAWRALLEGHAIEPPKAVEAWLGPRRHAVAYPVECGRRTNLVLVERGRDGPGGDRERLARSFAGWAPRLRAMIGAAARVDPWPILVTPPGRPWRHLGDRAILIGDAAHALMPYAAQGAAMAIEDGACLAAWLRRAPTLPDALAGYEAERRPRIEKVRKRVAFHRIVYHLASPAAELRNAVLAARSAEGLRRDLAWLYDWQPPA